MHRSLQITSPGGDAQPAVGHHEATVTDGLSVPTAIGGQSPPAPSPSNAPEEPNPSPTPIVLPQPGGPLPPLTLTLPGSVAATTISPSNGVYLVPPAAAGQPIQTLAPGGAITLGSGASAQTISFQSPAGSSSPSPADSSSSSPADSNSFQSPPGSSSSQSPPDSNSRPRLNGTPLSNNAPITLAPGTVATPLPDGSILLPSGVTLGPGASTTINGQTLVAAAPSAPSPGALILIQNGATTTLATPPASIATPLSNGALLLPNGATLLPGATTTLNGLVLALPSAQPSDAQLLLINGQPTTLAASPALETLAPGLIGTVRPDGAFVVAGTTIPAGQTGTVNGVAVVVPPAATPASTLPMLTFPTLGHAAATTPLPSSASSSSSSSSTTTAASSTSAASSSVGGEARGPGNAGAGGGSGGGRLEVERWIWGGAGAVLAAVAIL